MAYFDPQHTIPVRARAYNDCVKDAVLLKTASNRGIHGPQNGTILGPKDGTSVHTGQVLRGCPCIHGMYRYGSGYYPQNGTILGVLQMHTRSWVPGSLISGYFGVFRGLRMDRKGAIRGVRVCACV